MKNKKSPKWALNWAGNTASLSDGSKLITIESNYQTEKFDLVLNGETVLRSADTEIEAKEILENYINP